VIVPNIFIDVHSSRSIKIKKRRGVPRKGEGRQGGRQRSNEGKVRKRRRERQRKEE
jgi:hypothetical protein